MPVEESEPYAVKDAMSLNGNLKSFSLAEIFQSLALNRHTGTLCIHVVEGDTQTTRYIRFAEGDITFVSPASPKGFRLGEILVRQGKLTDSQVCEALVIQRETGEKLGQTLIARGLVSHEDIAEALGAQLREEIYDLFFLEDAEFEFKVNAEPPADPTGLLRTVKVSMAPQPLIMEGLKRLDEWPIIRTHVRTGHEIFIPTGVQPEGLDSDEREIYALIDGRTPVRELYERTTAGRFPCVRAIFNIVSAGLIRPLSADELVTLADQTPGNEKVHYLAYALQQRTADVALRIRTARTYHELDDDKAACVILREGLADAAPPRPEEQQKIAKELLGLRPTDKQALRAALDAALALSQHAEAVNRALDLADVLKRQNDMSAAREALQLVNDHVPDDPGLRLAVISRWRSLGNAKAALPHMEYLSARLTQEKNWTELVKILRWMMDADPTRMDIRVRINQISAELVAEEKHKRRRTIVTAVAAVIVAAVVIVPVVYESKAHVAFAWVTQRQTQLLHENAFDQAVEISREFLATYGWSRWADEARDSMKNIELMRERYDARIAEERSLERERIARLTEEPSKLQTEGTRREAENDLAGAFACFSTLINEFPQSPLARNVKLPLRLTSVPEGADVYAHKGVEDTEGGKKPVLEHLGRTPLVLHYRPGNALNLVVKRIGCRDATWSLAKDTTHEATVKLQWAPLAKISYQGPVHGQVLAWNDTAIFFARDGNLYRFDPFAPAIKWRRTMGRFGDPASRIATLGKKIYVGNAEGELACVDPETGDSIWQTRLPGGAYLMPLCRGEDDIIAATANGHVVRLQGAQIAAKVALEGRIANGPALLGDTVIVGTSCDLCYGLNAANLETRWRQSFESDIVAGPLAVGAAAAIFTAERKLYGLDAETGRILWQHTLPSGVASPPLVTDRELCVPLDNGEVHLFGLDGAPRAVGATGGGPIGAMCRHGRTLFFGNDAGACIAFDLAKAAVTWSYAGPTPIEAAPCVLKGRVLFATIKGDFLVMEILP